MPKNALDSLKPWFQNLVYQKHSFFHDHGTPILSFFKLKGHFAHCQFLESVEQKETWGRYTFIALGAYLKVSEGTENFQIQTASQQIKIQQLNPCQILDEIQSHFPTSIPFLALGYFGYNLVRSFENLPEPKKPDLILPDSSFQIPEVLITFDHTRQNMDVEIWAENPSKAKALLDQVVNLLQSASDYPLFANPLAQKNMSELGLAEYRSNTTKKEFCTQVEKAKEFIAAGDIYQVVLSQRLQIHFSKDPFLFYRYLRVLNPSPYLYYLQEPDFVISGSSPEVLVKKESQNILLRPIAGTRKRGKTKEEDMALEQELLADKKELAEHHMLIDLGRNDLGRICEFGSVVLENPLSIENYSHVKHIVSTVVGRVEQELSMHNLFRAVFPAGTLSGAPKIRAMEIIDALENSSRNFYGGTVWMRRNENLNACIGIRTAIFKDKKAYIQAGAGIVTDSDPEKEYEETLSKAKALLTALELAKTEKNEP